jgi:predicted nucleic acid-binding protein
VSEIVVDASVALCWFARETETLAANQLIAGENSLVAPSLLLLEFANGMWKKARRREIADDLVGAGMREIRRFVPQIVDIADLSGSALALARELDHSIYDCVYLALARRREAPFVTLDRRFVDKVAVTPYARDVVHLLDWS